MPSLVLISYFERFAGKKTFIYCSTRNNQRFSSSLITSTIRIRLGSYEYFNNMWVSKFNTNNSNISFRKRKVFIEIREGMKAHKYV